MTLFLTLITINAFLILFHLTYIGFKYAPYLISYVGNGISIWNKSYDVYRLVVSFSFLFIPSYTFYTLYLLNSTNSAANNIALILIATSHVFLIFVNKKHTWSEEIEIQEIIRREKQTKIYTFSDFFIDRGTFKSVLGLLIENGFINKEHQLNNKLKEDILILIMKLNSLGLLINLNRKNKSITLAAATFFNIKISESYFSKIHSNNLDELDTIHKDIFNSFNYLDKLSHNK